MPTALSPTKEGVLNTQSLPTPNVEEPPERRLAFLDGLRALAALWVVLFHLSAGKHIEALRAILPTQLNTLLFDSGYLGVPIFFVLSGFVMAYTTKNSIFNGNYAANFLLRRLARLTPPYYFALLVVVGSGAVKFILNPSAVTEFSWVTLLANACYVQGLLHLPDLNPVFWTLAIEVQFYILFACVQFLVYRASVGSKNIDISWLVIYIAMAIFCLIVLSGWMREYQKGSALPYLYAFFAGVLAYYSGYGKSFWLWLGVMYIASLFVLAHKLNSDFIAVVAVTSAALTVAGLRGGMNRWLNWAWLQNVARISFSLYLLHNPVTGAVFRVATKLSSGGALFDAVAALTSILFSILAATIAYYIVERPSLRFSRRLFSDHKPMISHLKSRVMKSDKA
jgi:peptidoglycan/LPS O-acetylase OafA/YrhL